MTDLNEARKSYTRVTTVLYPHSGLQKIDPEVVQNAADRGTKVHKICEGIMAGIGSIGVCDNTSGYVDSFQKWWDCGHQIHSLERRFWHDEETVTGQCDIILETNSGLAIVDLKTSSKPSKTWPVQGAAYAWLAKHNGLDIKKILFVHLNRHGKPPKVFEYPIDDDLWLACLRVYKHFYHEFDNG